ncbi:hypothetical protein AAFF_G00397810 [Aldrovandia affinis]|uniref:Uncharacterized protein n=1 Tax=Aldrovandia affinis TaxID=143900 RepID=A0AAD7SDQ0_9TELE|nr:hypothetical protein AAFF_G00397810 [Aldrovandia affinis]
MKGFKLACAEMVQWKYGLIRAPGRADSGASPAGIRAHQLELFGSSECPFIPCGLSSAPALELMAERELPWQRPFL